MAAHVGREFELEELVSVVELEGPITFGHVGLLP